MRGRGTGLLVPGAASQEGVICVFDGDLVGLIVTTRTIDPLGGLSDVRTFVEAYEAG